MYHGLLRCFWESKNNFVFVDTSLTLICATGYEKYYPRSKKGKPEPQKKGTLHLSAFLLLYASLFKSFGNLFCHPIDIVKCRDLGLSS